MSKIKNAVERATKLKNLVASIQQVQESWGAKPTTKMGRAIAQAAMVAHYYLEQDTVVYIAALRGRTEEITQFIEQCEKQLQDESK